MELLLFLLQGGDNSFILVFGREGEGTEVGIGCEIQFYACTRVNCIKVISFFHHCSCCT